MHSCTIFYNMFVYLFIYCGLFYDSVKTAKTNSQSKMLLYDHVTWCVLKAPLPRPLFRWQNTDTDRPDSFVRSLVRIVLVDYKSDDRAYGFVSKSAGSFVYGERKANRCLILLNIKVIFFVPDIRWVGQGKNIIYIILNASVTANIWMIFKDIYVLVVKNVSCKGLYLTKSSFMLMMWYILSRKTFWFPITSRSVFLFNELMIAM